MKGYIDIENTHTKDVITLTLDIILKDEKQFVFDISNLNNEQLIILKNAIDVEKRYTDIELFYIDDDNTPYFGPDYDFQIDGNHLMGKYNK